MQQKRIAAIHDISCFGKCSLTVALPLISATGIETAVIPTAVLSTHTGGFKGFTFRDLTEDILPTAEHWKSSGIAVDAVYTGYLGSKEQIDIVKQTVDLILRENGLVFVDPVMADHGRLYQGFDADFPQKMLELCSIADIITPNMTEAAFMLGIPYVKGPYTKEYIEKILFSLSEFTKAKIVLTGVWLDEHRIGAACLDNGRIDYAFSDYINAAFHGTGDVFASTLVASLMNGRELKKALQIAVSFTYACIKRTYEQHPGINYGVNFEAEIPSLIKYLEL